MKKTIKLLLKKYGGSHEKVAALLDVSVRYVYMLEKGDRKGGKHLRKFARMCL